MSESSTSTLPPTTVIQEHSTSRPSPQLNSPESASSHPSPVTANKPDRPHKSKQKSKDRGADDLEIEKVAILKNVSQTLLGASQDADETFGRQVVSEIKQIKDPATKMRLRRNILCMIYEAEQRPSSHPVPRSTTQPVNQTPWQGHTSHNIQPSYYQN